ncbi:MAG TPA: metallophosphoesterase family protein [Luteimonas sp.]
MRTIVHLSDLHFGRVDPALLDPLVAAVSAAQPDVVAVSGDLTQRARNAQFIQARRFLDRLPTPRIVVPGNHDIPLYDVVRRFASPLRRFRRHITVDSTPSFRDEEVAIVGINTARSLTFKNGRINAGQVAQVADCFSGLDPEVARVVVTHHPFDLPSHREETDLVGRATMAMRAFAQARVDLFLSGHLHQTHAGSTAARYRIEGHSALVVQAGTASSTRGRGEENSFNVIRIGRPEITVEVHRWDAATGAFAQAGASVYRRDDAGWSLAP